MFVSRSKLDDTITSQISLQVFTNGEVRSGSAHGALAHAPVARVHTGGRIFGATMPPKCHPEGFATARRQARALLE